MTPRKNNRLEKNRQSSPSQRFHPKSTPEERMRPRQDFEPEDGDFSLAKALAVTIVKRMLGLRREEKATPLVMEIADEIWLDGLEAAWKGYRSDKNAKFKTFLRNVLQRKAWKVWRRFFSLQPHKVLLNITTVRNAGICYGESAYAVDENGQAVSSFTRFAFDFWSCDFSFLPCGIKLINTPELASGDDVLEIEQAFSDDSPPEKELANREFYRLLGTISDEEFRERGREHLPDSYKNETDKALRKKLAWLDIQIVEKLIKSDKPTPQRKIQEELGISKYFYQARIDAILERLQVPYLSMERRKETSKGRKKRPRNLEPIPSVETDKLFVFSPPQPIEVTRMVDDAMITFLKK